MHFLKCFFLILPAVVFGFFEGCHIQDFAKSFQEKKFEKSLQILEDWELSQPLHAGRVLGMKAAVYLSMGNVEKSRMFMDQYIQNMEVAEASDPLVAYAVQMYYKALENSSEDLLVSFNGLPRLCKHEQPSGLKLKYWFGIGQVLVGILAAPFSAGASTALVLSGTAMVIDAASDALNNKEAWERDLNERQRIGPNFQKNSFSNYLPRALPDVKLI